MEVRCWGGSRIRRNTGRRNGGWLADSGQEEHGWGAAESEETPGIVMVAAGWLTLGGRSMAAWGRPKQKKHRAL